MAKFTFHHGHQSNLPHFLWLSIGFILGLVLYAPAKDLVIWLFLKGG